MSRPSWSAPRPLRAWKRSLSCRPARSRPVFAFTCGDAFGCSFCRDELVYETAVAPFREHRAEIEQLYTDFARHGFEEWDEDRTKDSIDYFEDFWKVVDDAEEFEKKITRDCRPW